MKTKDDWEWQVWTGLIGKRKIGNGWGGCCFVGFPKLLHHQSNRQSLKEGWLTHTRTNAKKCARSPLFFLSIKMRTLSSSLLIKPQKNKCSHLQHSAADEPVTAPTPDPKLSVVVSLTIRFPISVKNRRNDRIKPPDLLLPWLALKPHSNQLLIYCESIPRGLSIMIILSKIKKSVVL